MAKVKKPTKYIFVTGGVTSSLGKGLVSAALGALLESRGLRVVIVKLDPYINVDPGTMSPFQHGEVFVTDDGAETDLDLGHYERFTHSALGRVNNWTTGQIYERVITKERRGEYLGKTVQVIPHITDEIKSCVRTACRDTDIGIIEIGGTVGDIEGQPFLEAIRQFRLDAGAEHTLYIHLTLIPWLGTSGELKTKPTQHSVKELRAIGIQPDLLVCRTHTPLPLELKQKISLFCNVPVDAVISDVDADSIYEVPLQMHEEGLDNKVAELLNIWAPEADLTPWRQLNENIRQPRRLVTIAIVGKYVELTDAYKSLNEALVHGGLANQARVRLRFVEAEEVEQQGAETLLAGADGVLVPGGFGTRGSEGKIEAVRFAREHKVPYFGICLGLQMAVIEFARNVCGLARANSSELDPETPHPVVDLMLEQRKITDMGATMRLGAYPCTLKKGTLAQRIYGSTDISERHRHRYEVNNPYREQLEAGGLVLSGLSPDGMLVEVVEIADHPWFLGCQFHPEFKSKPLAPHPLFASFIEAAVRRRDEAGK